MSENAIPPGSSPPRVPARARLTFVDTVPGAAPGGAEAKAGQRARFARDVREGLAARSKRLHCRFFYDEEGSRLFEAICELPEYYITRAERGILSRHAGAIAAAVAGCETLVELGSGSAAKTRLVIDALLAEALLAEALLAQAPLARAPRLQYIPVDISREILERSSLALLEDYQALSVTAIAGEYEDGLRALSEMRSQPARQAVPVLPDGAGQRETRSNPFALAGNEKCEAKAAAGAASAAARAPGPQLVLWLGSNIGNLHRNEAAGFLSNVAGLLAPRDALLVGIDRRKPRSVIEPAYDDAAGVTARFNLNLLSRINRELGGAFDLAAFRHSARYDEAAGRIEMHLVSLREQSVRIRGTGEAGEPGYPLEIRFEKGETIHTENSYKYSAEEIAALAAASGLVVADRWPDPDGLFEDVLFRKAAHAAP